MAGDAIIATGNVRRTFTAGDTAIMTGDTGTRDFRMIHRIIRHWSPGANNVTGDTIV